MPIFVGAASSSFANYPNVGVGTTTTTGRNAGIRTSVGELTYNVDNQQLEVYDGINWIGGLTSPFGATGGTTERLRISSSGDITPGADATQDLGATDKRFANIYSADLQLSNEGSSNDVDGTWGKYTIQEGEDDLFLINRRTGRKYKFLLEEVN